MGIGYLHPTFYTPLEPKWGLSSSGFLVKGSIANINDRKSVAKISSQDIELWRIFRRYQELPVRIVGGLRISIKGIH